jgi:hypothetical protein
MRILLLYDTTEKDLARDLHDLLVELGLEVNMIPGSPNLGRTLQAKEEEHFSSARGAVFLVTPGSTRNATAFPSPSVADEMGQAKQKFAHKPESVIYLVDQDCKVQAVDQKAYISFNRRDIRSILEAVTALIRNLKAAGLIGDKRIEQRETPAVDIAEVWKVTENRLRDVCVELSKSPNGSMAYDAFRKALSTRLDVSDQDINFIVRDLQGLATYVATGQAPFTVNFFTLTGVGWELVRYHMARPRPSLASLIGALAGLPNPSPPRKG